MTESDASFAVRLVFETSKPVNNILDDYLSREVFKAANINISEGRRYSRIR